MESPAPAAATASPAATASRLSGLDLGQDQVGSVGDLGHGQPRARRFGSVASEQPQREQVWEATCLVTLCLVSDGHDMRSLLRCGSSLHDEDGAAD